MTNLDLTSLAPGDLEALSGLLSRLQAQQPAAPAAKPRRKRKQTEVKYLTEPELDRLFAVIKAPRDRAIFRIAYHRGLRASEIGRLDLADYDAPRRRMRIARRKGSHGGEYHLCESEIRALRSWLKVRGEAPGPLFPSRRGKGISQQMLDVLMKKYGAAAGLPPEKRHIHALKHSCGTHLLNRGEAIEDVQDHLGHVNIQNTLVYAKITNRRREARDDRLRNW